MKKTGITRKQAIKKMGKYAALTAIGTFAILNPKKAQAQSVPPGPPGWDYLCRKDLIKVFEGFKF